MSPRGRHVPLRSPWILATPSIAIFLFFGGLYTTRVIPRRVSTTDHPKVVHVLAKGLKGANCDSYAKELLQRSAGGLFQATTCFRRAWAKDDPQCREVYRSARRQDARNYPDLQPGTN